MVDLKQESKKIKKLIDNKEYEKALEVAEFYIKKYPDDIYFKFYRGKALFLLKNYKSSRKQLLKVVESSEFNSDDNQIYASSYFYLGAMAHLSNYKNIELAIKYYETAIEFNPKQADKCYISIAELEIDRGNYAKAYNLLNKCNNQVNLRVSLHKARALKGMHRFEEAQAILDNVDVKENDSYLYRRINIEKAHLASPTDYKKAEKYYQMALRGPKDYNYWLTICSLGNLYTRYQQYDKALECYKDLLGNESRFEDVALCEIAHIYQMNFIYQKALDLYKKIPKNSKHYFKAVYRSGLIYMNTGNYEEAKNCLSKVKFYNKQFQAKIIFSYIIALFRNKEYKEARQLLSTINIDDLTKNRYSEYLFLEEVLNNKIIEDRKSYPGRQMANYSMENFIKYTMASNKDMNDSMQHNYGKVIEFSDDVDIISLCKNASSMVQDQEPNLRAVFDYYDVYYDGITDRNKAKANSIRIITLPDTKQVIRIYPNTIPDTSKQKVKK